MRAPSSLVCLAAVAVAVVTTSSLVPTVVDARPMHTGIDYHRYLQEKDAIQTELAEWLAEFKDEAKKNGWLPASISEARSADDADEDQRQRFFLTKESIKKLEKENPDAVFSTKSSFTLLTDEEFNAYVAKGYRAGGGDDAVRSLRSTDEPVVTTDPSTAAPSTAPPSVESIDWSTSSPCVAPVQNQGQCGACWAFAIVAGVESAQCIANGKTTLVKFSEQQVASCDSRNNGCDGGVPQYAYQYIQKNGICTAGVAPYTSSAGKLSVCNSECPKTPITVNGLAIKQTESALISAVQKLSTVVAIQAGNLAFKQYTSGVLSTCASSAQVDHAALVVGYDTTAFKVKNLWGPRWGERGYIRLQRGTPGTGTCKMYSQSVGLTF